MVNAKPIWIFVALVFLIRAMVPVGFMPDFSGKHAIQICSGTEIKTIMVDQSGQPVGSDHQKQTDKACSFSFLSGGMAASTPEVVIGVPLSYPAGQQAFILELLTKFYAASPLSRGPPTLFV